MRYTYDTDSAKRYGAKRSYVDYMMFMSYIDYIKNNMI